MKKIIFQYTCYRLRKSSFIVITYAILSGILLAPGTLLSQTPFPYARPSRAELLSKLNTRNPDHDHPRLYARKADFDALREKIANDPTMAKWADDVIKAADKTVDVDVNPFEYDPDRLVPYSRQVPARIYTLAMAYQITQKQKYARRAYEEMNAIADWPAWGTVPTFLNAADIMQGFSVGYDWLYSWMNAQQRDKIRNAMIEKGLKKIIDIYNSNPAYTFQNKIGNVFGNNNWNPWCNGAAFACALDIGEDNPDVAGEVMERALRVVENFAGTFGPDGGSVEGPGYGNGSMSTYIKWIATMETALGTSYNYFDVPGIADYVYFPIYTNGPVASLNFHDAGNDAKKYLDVTFFIANKIHNPELGKLHASDINSGDTKPGIFDLLWYKPEDYNKATGSLPLDRYFRGLVQTGSFRSSFTDPNALFLAFHAGENDVAHTHMDIGQFNIDALGLNWALDLGTEKLTYDRTMNNTYSSRYELYRINPGGHNTLLINPSKEYGQSLPAFNPVTSFSSKADGGFAIVDMTKAYQTQVNFAHRGYALLDNRSKIIIQDELELKEPSTVWWFMHTRASISISDDGRTAILKQKGKRMRATIVSPEGAKFLALESKPLPETNQNAYQTPNTGIQNLSIKIEQAKNTTIMVEIIPVLNDNDLNEPTLHVVSLNNWNEKLLKGK